MATEPQPTCGNLTDDKRLALAALTLTAVAIEARANHLIDWLIEIQAVGKDAGAAARWLPTKHKWFLLPKLAGKSDALDASAEPHQSIAQVLALRNDVMHVKFDDIAKGCPSCSEMTRLFRSVVAALEDMNVVLGRETTPRDEVIALGVL
jgi:hypothetical protein